MASRRLKSPQSLYCTSIQPTMVTHRSESWSWMANSQPFLSVSISTPTPIPQIKLFQTLTFKLQSQGHRCGQMARPYSHPVSNWFAFFLFHINQTTILHIQLFLNLSLKNQRSMSWVRSNVRSHSSPSIPLCTSYSFHINQTNHSWDMSNRVFDLEKTHATAFCSDWLSGSHFILQTSKYFVYQSHSRDLGSRSPEGHPVHLSRPILSLSQTSKV